MAPVQLDSLYLDMKILSGLHEAGIESFRKGWEGGVVIATALLRQMGREEFIRRAGEGKEEGRNGRGRGNTSK